MSPQNRISRLADVNSLPEREALTAAEKRRERFYKQMQEFRSHKPERRGSSPAAEQMIREDRER